MKKKRIVPGIVILLLVCLGVYFWPKKLSDLIGENSTVSISVSELGVREGLPYIDTDSCLDMTKEQKSELTALFGDYSYRRSFGTLFSDGSMTEIGDHLIYVFVYEEDVLKEQKSELTALFGDYSYRRSFGTLFSDGSMTEIGDHLIYVFVYEEDVLKNSIVISSAGQCSVNDKSYRMADAEHLIGKIRNSAEHLIGKIRNSMEK